MGKHEKGTPKEIANRCKSKGLQKLRWFCQMCQKQCRDQNGFKCHLTSEAHQRQLLLFAENPDDYLKEYSKQFETNFLKTLRCTFGTKRVRANEVYQEYIRDKMHVHMNSTTWHTLTNFVQYLGSSGKCRIDLTEKGWFIALINQEEEMRKEELVRRAKSDRDDDERQQEFLQRQAERAKELQNSSVVGTSQPSELLRKESNDKITINLSMKKLAVQDAAHPTSSGVASASNVFEKPMVKKEACDSRSHSNSYKRRQKDVSQRKRKADYEDYPTSQRKADDNKHRKSALDEIREMEEKKKERHNRKDYWLHTGIIVKVLTKKLGVEYYKAKGIVESLVDEYTATVNIDGDILKLDQRDVETVIPAIGRKMLIVNGAYRNTRAVLEKIDEPNFSVILRLIEGFARDRVVCVPYEDASKLAD
ncbi:hypothetical protein AB6A40_004966 [Gnathostoma spinigerum]|uniref:DNA/RNA-binding protein Kin17 WH-like domain-containing protein n=1 Tax=Gnathostoma spinigerum TaxID=75299 RepID=A0ABD6ENK4_9BILA